jgi:hypothetical protein
MEGVGARGMEEDRAAITAHKLYLKAVTLLLGLTVVSVSFLPKPHNITMFPVIQVDQSIVKIWPHISLTLLWTL